MHTEEKNPSLEIWRQKEVAEYDLPLKEAPSTILDIGANVGAWSLRCAQQYPNAVICAYEPVLSNAIALEKNTRGKNVRVINSAVRKFSGSDNIFIGERDVTSSFFQLGRQTQTQEFVSCIAASMVPAGELVKIDTEGCELEIVEAIDLTNTSAIIVEYHRDDAIAISALLEARGFQLVEHKEKEKGYGLLKFARLGVLKEVERKARKIYLAVAHHHSGMDTICSSGLLALFSRPPCPIHYGAQADSGLLRARNMLSARFLESDCTHLLFIDGDIGFTPNDVDRITSHDEDIVGGMYPLKNVTRDIQWCGNGLLQDKPVRADGLKEVRYVGTGFCCIRRNVFEKMIAEDREAIEYKSDFPPHQTEWDFWRQGPRETGVGKIRYLTEDWLFCQRWLELGGKVFADTYVTLRHAGRAVWPLLLQDNNPFGSDSQLSTPNSQPS